MCATFILLFGNNVNVAKSYWQLLTYLYNEYNISVLMWFRQYQNNITLFYKVEHCANVKADFVLLNFMVH